MLDVTLIPAALREARDPLAARIESAALSVAQPRQQSFYDGWLLRYSPGKARRARSVNSIGAGVLPLAEKIAYCSDFYQQRNLPVIFRLTPFAQPTELDAVLAGSGFAAVGDTRVMKLAIDAARVTAPITARISDAHPSMRLLDVEQFADAFGQLHGLDAAKTSAERDRYAQSAISSVYVGAYVGEMLVACGSVAIDGTLAGIFGMVTAVTHRGRGVATAIVAELLQRACDAGARTAYLQVEANNIPARRVYSKFGFEDCYAYWYRVRSEAEGQ